MGQAALSDRVTPYPARVDYIVLHDVTCLTRRAKGNRVNIPDPVCGDRRFGVQSGNANKLGDVGWSSGKSCLFFVRSIIPGIDLFGDRDFGFRKAARVLRCPVHSSRPLKIRGR